jgi:phospholipid transport system substrate-binding protein
VDYAFHKTPDGWKAFDVIVEGISYITTYRNQIMPDVQANGIDSVLERLGSGQLELAE